MIGALVHRQVDSAPLVALAMIAAGGLVGAINGLVCVFGGLPHPFIISLATLSVRRCLALALAVNHTTMRGMPDAIVRLGESLALGVPNSFFFVLAVALILLVVTRAMGAAGPTGSAAPRRPRSRWAFR